MSKDNLALRGAASNSVGPIITMNPRQPRAQALAVRDGRIVAVGTWKDVAPHAEGMTVLDLNGKTVLPGLIDTHTHFLWTALSLAALDTSEAEDHAALQAIVRQAVADTPPGELILGMGFTEYALDTATFSPILQALDAVAPENPIYLIGVTGHTFAVNGRALKLLVPPDDMPGVVRDANGQPNGLLTNEANNLAFKKLGKRFGIEEKATEMIARGDVKQRGVVPPETAIDPEILFAELARRKIEIHEKIEEYHVI
jgi:predicted amidohydrolase YtcJ